MEKNYNNVWFNENKTRYQDEVLEPARAFIRALVPRLKKVSKHIVADDAKQGGSKMRIYRDTRFSKDKRPLNTHVSMIFRHDVGKSIDTPGFYVSHTAKEATISTGIWHPEKEGLASIRNRIVEKPGDWKKARNDAAFRKLFGELQSESLKRPPKGLDSDHELIDDMGRKDLCAFYSVKWTQITKKSFSDLATAWKTSNKLMPFLCRALGLENY